MVKTITIMSKRTAVDCKQCKGSGHGYHLCEWVGGRKSWKALGSATYLADVLKYAEPFKRILIRCNGCGEDIVREYAK